MSTQNITAIIPARMGSSRFPGKPMAKILDIPMIGHIYKRASMCNIFSEVYVATCDKEIFDYIESIGGKAVMTADTHERCTDRTSEAMEKIEAKTKKKIDVVAMIQGDEPLITKEVFIGAIEALKSDSKLPLVNIMSVIQNSEELNSENTVKVVVDKNMYALYLSREPIPSPKKAKGIQQHWYKQTGMIFFKRDYLLKFNAMESTYLEKCESVDMLRVLEHGDKLKMVITNVPSYGVDIPSDVQLVEKYLAKDAMYLQYKNALK